MLKYFAYGSNCNPAIMQKKGVEFASRRRAVLRGYRLLFNKRALREALPEGIGFANINPDAEGTVEGILYEIVADHLAFLDQSERYPEHYNRIEVEVQSENGTEPCLTYVAQADKTAAGLIPSRNYLNHILAARDFLSHQYFQALDQSQTYTGECACCGTTGEVVFLKEQARMFMVCQPCREAKTVWGDARGRRLSVAEAEAIMIHLVSQGQGFSSVQELIQEAIARRLIDP